MKKRWTEEDVLKILAIMKSVDTRSLNDKVTSNATGKFEDTELQDIIMDDQPGPQEIAEQNDLNRILNKAVDFLKPREKLIIVLRYGLKDGKCRTLEEVANMYHVTRERIRQVEAKALKRLAWIIKHKFKLKRGDL